MLILKSRLAKGHLPRTIDLGQKAEAAMRKTLNWIFSFSIYLIHLAVLYCVEGVECKIGNKKIWNRQIETHFAGGKVKFQGIRYFDGPFPDRKMDDGKWLVLLVASIYFLLRFTNLDPKVFRSNELSVNNNKNLISHKEILLTCLINVVHNGINTLSVLTR